jgi:hypothetical protein
VHLEVRRGQTVVGAEEAPALTDVRDQRARPGRLRPGELHEVVVVHQVGGVAGAEHQRRRGVVVQVLAHAGQVEDHVDADLAQVGAGTDAREHEQLG